MGGLSDCQLISSAQIPLIWEVPDGFAAFDARVYSDLDFVVGDGFDKTMCIGFKIFRGVTYFGANFSDSWHVYNLPCSECVCFLCVSLC